MKQAPAWILSVSVAVLFLAPLIWMLRASFGVESQIFQPGFVSGIVRESWTLQNYADAWRRAALGRAICNSLLQITGIASVGLVINAMAAYAFARMEFFGRDLLFGVLVVLIILPVEVLAVPMFLTAHDLGLTGSYGQTMVGLIAPFLAKAFNIYFLRQHFLALPTELEEAAVIDGAGVVRQFWNVALPSVRPALATVVGLDLITHWGDFLWPLMMSTREETRTVQISLANLFTQPPIQWGAILACSVLATLPVIVLFYWLQHCIVITDTRAGIK
jgi:multiple sugar transport system permease protein/fructooligosaccharide transport system permease protein